MNTHPDIIFNLSVINDNLFKELLFNAEGQQFKLSYEKAKTMTTEQIVSDVIDYYADSRPGWEGKMISVKLCKELYKTIPKSVAAIQ